MWFWIGLTVIVVVIVLLRCDRMTEALQVVVYVPLVVMYWLIVTPIFTIFPISLLAVFTPVVVALILSNWTVQLIWPHISGPMSTFFEGVADATVNHPIDVVRGWIDWILDHSFWPVYYWFAERTWALGIVAFLALLLVSLLAQAGAAR